MPSSCQCYGMYIVCVLHSGSRLARETRLEQGCSYSDHNVYTSLRPNLVWGNQEPMWPTSEAALKAIATPRLKDLALAKVDHRPPDTFM